MDEVSFGRYRLLSVIGRGGMGTVWRAHDSEIGRDVAVKVLPMELGGEPGYRQRFKREALTAARLTEPHIIPIYDTGEIDGQLYLVMPVIEGVDVHTLLQREGAMKPQRAVHIVEQLAAALDAAHAVGLVHRDIKPSNALVTGRDFVYLIDFGIAHDASATKLTSTGMIVGTMAYMAPERFTAGVADKRSDVYALACVLHECLTGQQPFPGDSMEQQIAGHLTLDPPRPSQTRPGLASGLDAVIATGMAKSPDERYQSALELATTARHAMTAAPSVGAPTRHHTPPPKPRPNPAPRRTPPTQPAPPFRAASFPPVPSPPPAHRPAPQPAPARRAQLRGAPLAATVAIAAVLVIIGIYLVSRPASTPQSSTPTLPLSGVLRSTTVAEPSPITTVSSGVPGLAPFVGSWHAHREGLVISANGHGQHTYASGMENFTLTSVSGDTATGAVDSTSNTGGAVPGDPVTVTLVGNGQGLQFSAGKEQQFPYCKNGGTDFTLCGA